MYSLLIVFFLLALVFSFLCSMWEAVLLSITPSYAHAQSQQGTAVGHHLQDFKANIDRPLAAILTLNTIAHTVGAIGVGDQAVRIWSDANPLLTMFVVPAVMTIAILVLSEIVPKTIGALYWRRLTGFTVHSLRTLIVILAPLVWMSQYITGRLKKGSGEAILTRTDFMAMAELGAQEGVFHADETAMIGSLLRFKNVQVRDVMTPRTVVAAAAESDPVEALYHNGERHRFSRIPLYTDTKDHVTGYVLRLDALNAVIEGNGSQPLATLRREIITVGETFGITDLFNTLRDRQEHIAAVIDEFGGLAGIITMEDIIETLLGLEIVDETDTTTDMRVLAQRHRARRASSMGVLDPEEAHTPG